MLFRSRGFSAESFSLAASTILRVALEMARRSSFASNGVRAPGTSGKRASRTRNGARVISRKVTLWRAAGSGTSLPPFSLSEACKCCASSFCGWRDTRMAGNCQIRENSAPASPLESPSSGLIRRVCPRRSSRTAAADRKSVV